MTAMIEEFEKSFRACIDELYSGDDDLSKACRYALEGQGKRVRPQLVLLSHQIFDPEWKRALPSALAVEWVHTYSLVHDDLPCMDDDDWRRGRPSVHKVFGEATALLVGGALLSDAFLILGGGVRGLEASSSIVMVRELASAIGASGMVLGQSLDLQWTGKHGYSLDVLNGIHRRKTGNLIAASCVLGASSAGADSGECELLRKLGENFGLAFQITDDVLDAHTGTGKTQGKDQKQGKLTYLSLMSPDDAIEQSRLLIAEACKLLQSFGPKAFSLEQFLRSLVQRQR